MPYEWATSLDELRPNKTLQRQSFAVFRVHPNNVRPHVGLTFFRNSIEHIVADFCKTPRISCASQRVFNDPQHYYSKDLHPRALLFLDKLHLEQLAARLNPQKAKEDYIAQGRRPPLSRYIPTLALFSLWDRMARELDPLGLFPFLQEAMVKDHTALPLNFSETIPKFPNRSAYVFRFSHDPLADDRLQQLFQRSVTRVKQELDVSADRTKLQLLRSNIAAIAVPATLVGKRTLLFALLACLLLFAPLVYYKRTRLWGSAAAVLCSSGLLGVTFFGDMLFAPSGSKSDQATRDFLWDQLGSSLEPLYVTFPVRSLDDGIAHAEALAPLLTTALRDGLLLHYDSPHLAFPSKQRQQDAMAILGKIDVPGITTVLTEIINEQRSVPASLKDVLMVSAYFATINELASVKSLLAADALSTKLIAAAHAAVAPFFFHREEGLYCFLVLYPRTEKAELLRQRVSLALASL